MSTSALSDGSKANRPLVGLEFEGAGLDVLVHFLSETNNDSCGEVVEIDLLGLAIGSLFLRWSEALFDESTLLVLEGARGLDLTLDSDEERASIGREVRHTLGVVELPVDETRILDDDRSHASSAIVIGNLHTIDGHISDERNRGEDILHLTQVREGRGKVSPERGRGEREELTSVVATFSPFHRKVSPTRSDQKKKPNQSRRKRSPELK
jgi:hypothetical protein